MDKINTSFNPEWACKPYCIASEALKEGLEYRYKEQFALRAVEDLLVCIEKNLQVDHFASAELCAGNALEIIRQLKVNQNEK
jgi:hypothetical protein